MNANTYDLRRSQLEAYFDRTAAAAWARLTSDQPLGRIRATVRAGRERMRLTLLDWLPVDLRGARLLDAGCGTGSLAVEAARRGAHVVAIDVASSLVDLARDRMPRDLSPGRIEFLVGDMLDPSLGEFDYTIAMDSFIHYEISDIVNMVSSLTLRTRMSVQFTFAPRTAALSLMHAVGRLFPRANRAPAIEPVGESRLRRELTLDRRLGSWNVGRTSRVASGFYQSQALELYRS